MAKRDLWEVMLERKRPLDIELVNNWMVSAAVAVGFFTIIMAWCAVMGGE